MGVISDGGRVLSVFGSTHFMDHESVHFGFDESSGLRSIVAIHSTALGPSLGGTRFYPYISDSDALTDVLRLSRSMSHKAALAGLDQGGGKAVIIGDPRQLASTSLFEKYGDFINGLCGRYITAEDVGTTVANMVTVATRTPFVKGLPMEDGGSGDPSPATARGVVAAIKAVAAQCWNTDDLAGRTVAIKGVGKVGYGLAELLTDLGASLIVADVNSAATDRAERELGAAVAAVDSIRTVKCDIFAPCALGGDLNSSSIALLNCEAVVGSANNQLATQRDADRLKNRGILYAPDFLVNAGGIINIAAETGGYTIEKSNGMVDNIYNTLLNILDTADRRDVNPHVAALEVAQQRIDTARKQGDNS